MSKRILIKFPFVKKLIDVTAKSCKNNSGILDFVEKKVMRVFKCDVTYIEEIKHFQNSKPFFIFIM